MFLLFSPNYRYKWHGTISTIYLTWKAVCTSSSANMASPILALVTNLESKTLRIAVLDWKIDIPLLDFKDNINNNMHIVAHVVY